MEKNFPINQTILLINQQNLILPKIASSCIECGGVASIRLHFWLQSAVCVHPLVFLLSYIFIISHLSFFAALYLESTLFSLLANAYLFLVFFLSSSPHSGKNPKFTVEWVFQGGLTDPLRSKTRVAFCYRKNLRIAMRMK